MNILRPSVIAHISYHHVESGYHIIEPYQAESKNSAAIYCISAGQISYLTLDYILRNNRLIVEKHQPLVFKFVFVTPVSLGACRRSCLVLKICVGDGMIRHDLLLPL